MLLLDTTTRMKNIGFNSRKFFDLPCQKTGFQTLLCSVGGTTPGDCSDTTHLSASQQILYIALLLLLVTRSPHRIYLCCLVCCIHRQLASDEKLNKGRTDRKEGRWSAREVVSRVGCGYNYNCSRVASSPTFNLASSCFARRGVTSCQLTLPSPHTQVLQHLQVRTDLRATYNSTSRHFHNTSLWVRTATLSFAARLLRLDGTLQGVFCPTW